MCAEFERELERYEMANGAALPEPARLGIVLGMTTGKLHDHVVRNLGELSMYAQVRSTTLHYRKSKKLTTARATHGPQPLDVGAI